MLYPPRIIGLNNILKIKPLLTSTRNTGTSENKGNKGVGVKRRSILPAHNIPKGWLTIDSKTRTERICCSAFPFISPQSSKMTLNKKLNLYEHQQEKKWLNNPQLRPHKLPYWNNYTQPHGDGTKDKQLIFYLHRFYHIFPKRLQSFKINEKE